MRSLAKPPNMRRLQRAGVTSQTVLGTTVLLSFLALGLSAAAHEPHDSAAALDEPPHHAGRFSHGPEDYPPPLGLSLTEGWLDPWSHSHFSRRGTPFVHHFRSQIDAALRPNRELEAPRA